jgi:hypothetical protein
MTRQSLNAFIDVLSAHLPESGSLPEEYVFYLCGEPGRPSAGRKPQPGGKAGQAVSPEPERAGRPREG